MSLRGPKKLVEALVSFLNNAFELGYDLSEASKFFAAVLDAQPGYGPKENLPRSRRCLKGWHRLDPGKTRPPLPWALVALIVTAMMMRRPPSGGTDPPNVLHLYETGEALGLRKEEDLIQLQALQHQPPPGFSAGALKNGHVRREHPARLQARSVARGGARPARPATCSTKPVGSGCAHPRGSCEGGAGVPGPAKKIQREAIAAADNFNRVAQKSFGVRTHMRLG